mmetsp:Transcript_28557/g.57501  ORF Transcript_28557/g.57501 Transcript_28557/m.57501 type:complete len:262 (+) Transcript_28557:47-832(+)
MSALRAIVAVFLQLLISRLAMALYPGKHHRSCCDKQLPPYPQTLPPSPVLHRRDFVQAATASAALLTAAAPAVAATAAETALAAAPALVPHPAGPVEALAAAAGDWLVAHPAPPVLVNNPLKRWFAVASAGSYDEAAVRERLAALLAADDVVLFTYSYDVAFGRTARLALENEGVEVRVYFLDRLEEGPALVAEIAKQTGRSSIPVAFVAGLSIGGCNDGSPGVRPLLAQPGGLREALAKCSPSFQERARVNRERLGLSPL